MSARVVTLADVVDEVERELECARGRIARFKRMTTRRYGPKSRWPAHMRTRIEEMKAECRELQERLGA